MRLPTWLLQLPPWTGFLGLAAGIILVTVPVVAEYCEIGLHETILTTITLVFTALGMFIIHLVSAIFAPDAAIPKWTICRNKREGRYVEIRVSHMAPFALLLLNFVPIIAFELLEEGWREEQEHKRRLLQLCLELSRFFSILQAVVSETTMCWLITRDWTLTWFPGLTIWRIVLSGAGLQCLSHIVLIGVSINQNVGQHVASLIWYPGFLSRVAIFAVFGSLLKDMALNRPAYWLVDGLVIIFGFLCVASLVPFWLFFDKTELPNAAFHCLLFITVAGSSAVTIRRLGTYKREEKGVYAPGRPRRALELDALELMKPENTYARSYVVSCQCLDVEQGGLSPRSV
ncbi:hypothetical protein B0T16DRAFT_450968 [Cercophora newfieldiana]|uniref:Uncharacterized protein n=1 Tax=Cercophora newfieldiana TaxID=92897 RepID=A0AA39YQ85_9PEZI|nr:hypothetical protein B0T16DRAFT_450968 [Cercophora newfieldiana]